jgi:DNA-binding beta-propeller fold protein YncE
MSAQFRGGYNPVTKSRSFSRRPVPVGVAVTPDGKTAFVINEGNEHGVDD